MPSNNMLGPTNLKFRYEDFLMDDIPNLMINIWSYSDHHGTGCTTCTEYKKMCIDTLKKKMGTVLYRYKYSYTKTKKKRHSLVRPIKVF